ncbi:hypothetical protein HB826_02510 [Listeria fleischmannii]|uniref:Uncharacterized protein n=2 Tax=Listeria fleischmannii TaxID=1069827 RepID=A0A841YCZ8_9LIST|nr:hypothetical protein [Listeria fleischmannii]MBC1426119.1 hypothetical protein [Listeria fleischmannii]
MCIQPRFLLLPFLLIAFTVCGFYFFESKQMYVQQLSNFWQKPDSKYLSFELAEKDVVNWGEFAPDKKKMIFKPILDGGYKMFAFYCDNKNDLPPLVQQFDEVSFKKGAIIGKDIDVMSIEYQNKNFAASGIMGVSNKSSSLDRLIFISLLEFEKMETNFTRTYIISTDMSEREISKELKAWNSSIENIRFLPYEAKGTARFLNTKLNFDKRKMWLEIGISLIAVISTVLWLSKQRQYLLISKLIGFKYTWITNQLLQGVLVYALLPMLLIVGSFRLIIPIEMGGQLLKAVGVPALLSLILTGGFLLKYKASRGLK